MSGAVADVVFQEAQAQAEASPVPQPAGLSDVSPKPGHCGDWCLYTVSLDLRHPKRRKQEQRGAVPVDKRSI